jgi:RHS repeat-associated protein
VYDGDGQRVLVKQTTSSQTDKTIYIGGYFEVFIKASYSASPAPVPNCGVGRSCIYLPLNITTFINPTATAGQIWKSYYSTGSGQVMRVQDNVGGSGLFWLYTDHLGSTTVTARMGGFEAELVSTLSYTAWGETRADASSGTTPTSLRYTGQREAEAGLYFYQARWYDPALGRFAQADTIIPGQDAVAFDRYAYVNNNPVNFNDPTGHMINCSICAWWDQFYKNTMRSIGKALAYNNNEADKVEELMTLAFFQEPNATITGKALDDIAGDKTIQAKQKYFAKQLVADPKYEKEDFSKDFGTLPITFGEMGNNNMLEDALQSQTWTVRAANVSVSAKVTKAGDIQFNYTLNDTLDLVPDWDSGTRTGVSGFFYNVTTTILGGGWHGWLGARKMNTSASWTTYVDRNWAEEEK